MLPAALVSLRISFQPGILVAPLGQRLGLGADLRPPSLRLRFGACRRLFTHRYEHLTSLRSIQLQHGEHGLLPALWNPRTIKDERFQNLVKSGS